MLTVVSDDANLPQFSTISEKTVKKLSLGRNPFKEYYYVLLNSKYVPLNY